MTHDVSPAVPAASPPADDSAAAARPGRRARRPRRIPVVEILALLVVAATLVAAAVPGLLATHDPVRAVPVDRLLGFGVDGHLLGTDAIGRDVWSRLVHGARVAWVVALVVAVGSVVIGGLLGAVAGYRGGRLDSVLARVIDSVLAFPPILLGLILAAILGPSTKTAVIALVVVYSPLTARVMRAAVMGECALPYVTASRALGHRSWRTLLLEIGPNTVGPMLVVATLIGSRAVIVEASLSFLGVGTQAPRPTWGLMAAEAQNFVLTDQRLVVVPVVALAALVLAMNVLGDELADRLDPMGRTVRSGGK